MDPNDPECLSALATGVSVAREANPMPSIPAPSYEPASSDGEPILLPDPPTSKQQAKAAKARQKAFDKFMTKLEKETKQEEEDEKEYLTLQIKQIYANIQEPPPRFSKAFSLAKLKGMKKDADKKLRVFQSFTFYKALFANGAETLEAFTKNKEFFGFHPELTGLKQAFGSRNPQLDELLKQYLEENLPSLELPVGWQLLFAICSQVYLVHKINTDPILREYHAKMAAREQEQQEK